MAEVQIWLTTERANSTYDALLPDETLSSWAHRHADVRLTSLTDKEYDYGAVQIRLPGIPRVLLNQLRAAARRPDPWLLQPWERTLRCDRCLAEDWAAGRPAYLRRAWTVAWRTCCAVHGRLTDVSRHPVPGWVTLLEAGSWAGRRIRVSVKRPNAVLLDLDLNNDRRAIHLESALGLGPRRATWFPRGMNRLSLRAVYAEIIGDLLNQFFVDGSGPPERLPSPVFNGQENSLRFALNVLAEAIVSHWSQTPLPDSANDHLTTLMVRAIGWGQTYPHATGRGQIFIRGRLPIPTTRDRYRTQFPHALLGNPPTSRTYPYFTLAEARQLNLNFTPGLQWLADATVKGQFLAFDAWRGRLRENTSLPPALRLDPQVGADHEMELPQWAYRQPIPQQPTDWLPYTLFSPLSPEELTKLKALRKQARKQCRETIRFSPQQ